MSTDPSPLAGRKFERILLIKLSALGDVVHTVALLNALRRHYPAARIDWLLKPSLAELIRHHPAVSNVLVYGKNHTEAPRYNWDGVKLWLQIMRDPQQLGMLRELRRARYDLVIDVQSQLRTGFLGLVTGAPVRIGFDRPRREVWEAAGRSLPPGTMKRSWRGARDQSWVAFTHHIRLENFDLHAVDRYLRVGHMLGIPDVVADFDFPISKTASDRIDHLLGDAGIAATDKPIVIAPATLWETKRWRPESLTEVARHFQRSGRKVVLIGSPAERVECEAIAQAVPGIANLAGRTSLIEVAALIRRAAICLSNDSGPMHMAVALGRPVVGIFGPTNPQWVGPYKRGDAVLRADLPCSPCNLRVLKSCPHDHACMREIMPRHVIDRMEALIIGTSSTAGL